MRKEQITDKTLKYFSPDIKIAVVGAGPFGYMNSRHLGELGFEHFLYDIDKKIITGLQHEGKHPYHFRQLRMNKNVRPTADLEEAVHDADLVVMAVSSQFVRNAARDIAQYLKKYAVILDLAKGLELGENNAEGKAKVLSEVIREEINEKGLADGLNCHIAAAGGGMFASDMARGGEVYITMASGNANVAEDLCNIFKAHDYYTQPWHDRTGVELIGAIKNVKAISDGIGRELRKTLSSRAGFLSAYSREMKEMVCLLGGKPETFDIGVYACGGDVMATCMGNKSRNLEFGRRLVRGRKEGKSPAGVYEEMRTERKTVEGYAATKAFHNIVKDPDMKIKMGGNSAVFPLLTQTYRILYENKDPRTAIECLRRYAGMHR